MLHEDRTDIVETSDGDHEIREVHTAPRTIE